MPKIRNETKIPALTTTQHCTEAKHQENWGVGGGRSGGEKEKSPDQKGKIKIMSICRQYDLVYRKPQGIHTHTNLSVLILNWIFLSGRRKFHNGQRRHIAIYDFTTKW